MISKAKSLQNSILNGKWGAAASRKLPSGSMGATSLPLAPWSNDLSRSMSSDDSSKSRMSRFWSILAGVTLLGMTAMPRWTLNLRMTWAAVLPYFLATSWILGSSRRLGSPSLAHGLSGDPRGLKAVRKKPFSLQKLLSFSWLKYGWHSTWLVAGLIFPLSKMSWICTELKLDRPMSFTMPFSTSFSIASQVSVGLTSSYMRDPSSFLGNLFAVGSPVFLKAYGQWIRYRST